jgi:hypothetical protein
MKMNCKPGEEKAINLSEIDRVLATEEPLIPTSGFLTSVMESVREESVAPAPIPFPWKRIVPGMLLVTGFISWGAFEMIREGLPPITSMQVADPHLSAAAIQPLEQAGWVALGLGVSLLSWLLSRRLVSRSGLL